MGVNIVNDDNNENSFNIDDWSVDNKDFDIQNIDLDAIDLQDEESDGRKYPSFDRESFSDENQENVLSDFQEELEQAIDEKEYIEQQENVDVYEENQNVEETEIVEHEEGSAWDNNEQNFDEENIVEETEVIDTADENIAEEDILYQGEQEAEDVANFDDEQAILPEDEVVVDNAQQEQYGENYDSQEIANEDVREGFEQNEAEDTSEETDYEEKAAEEENSFLEDVTETQTEPEENVDMQAEQESVFDGEVETLSYKQNDYPVDEVMNESISNVEMSGNVGYLKWYSGRSTDEMYMFDKNSPSGSFYGDENCKVLHVNVGYDTYGWEVQFPDGVIMNLRDIREYQIRNGRLPSTEGRLIYGQRTLMFSGVERIVVYESVRYFSYGV